MNNHISESTIKRHLARLLSLKAGEGCDDELWKQLESIGWKDIISVASEQQIMPLLFNKIKKLGLENRLKPEICRTISIERQKDVSRNVVFKHVLKNVIHSLNQHDVKAIVLKGAIMYCENIYRNSYARSMEDLDILIREEDFPIARKCMLDANLSYVGSNVPYDLHEDFEDKEVLVELHYLPVPKKYASLFDMNSFWANAIEVEIDGIKAFVPNPTDQIYLGFVHDMIRHQDLINFQIRDLYDFVMTTQYYKERIDWEEISARVKKNDIDSLFKLYCWHINKNFSLELPEPINNLDDENIIRYEKWYNQLRECPRWLESASERLMAILIKGGDITNYLKNSFRVLVKDSVLNESREFLTSIYHIEGRNALIPFIRVIHFFRVLTLHVFIIFYLAKRNKITWFSI